MSTHSSFIDHWLKATRTAVIEVLGGILETEAEDVVIAQGAELPAGDRHGAFVSIVGEDLCVQIGLAMNWDDCERMTRIMFQMDDGDPVEHDEVIDALGEMVNIIGGNAKRQGLDSSAGVELGLPLHFQGRLVVTGRQCLCVMHASCKGISFDVAVIMGDQSLYYADETGEHLQANR